MRLTKNVNDHMLKNHPLLFAGYTEGSLVRSARYKPPEDRSHIRPEYTQPRALSAMSEWGDAKKAPDITEEDRKMLRENKIAW